MHLRRILAAIALLCAIASPCHAQKTKAQLDLEITNSYPDNHAGAITPQVLRNVSSDVVNSIMPTAPVVSGNNACFDGTTGLLKDCGQAPTSITLTAGTGITLTGSCNGSSVNCTIASVSSQALIPSRAIALTENLSGLSAVTTQGYSTPGDGGGATFIKIGAATPFSDSFISGSTFTAGATCTNATYYGVEPTGGTGTGLIAMVTVSGGIVTAVNFANSPGNGYKVGDVLTIPNSITGCATAATITVTAVSSPLGSFTDSAGDRFQIIMPAAGIDVRSFGVKLDWTTSGGDAGATNNFTSFQDVIWFAKLNPGGFYDTAVGIGGKVLIPNGTMMVCSGGAAVIVSDGVTVQGQGRYTSIVKFCDTDTSGIQMSLCDYNEHFTCYNARLFDTQLFNTYNTAPGSNFYTTLYTNNDQDTTATENVVVYTGACRRALWLDTGYGGASSLSFKGLFETKGGLSAASCTGGGAPNIFINYGSASVQFDTLIGGGVAPGSGGPRVNGVLIQGGLVTIYAFHFEQVTNPILVSSSAVGALRLFGGVGGVDCTYLVTGTAAVVNYGIVISPPSELNGCTGIYQNNQSGASGNFTGPATTDTVFNPNTHSW